MTKKTARFTEAILACLLYISSRGYGQRQFPVEIVECEGSGCHPGEPRSPVWSFSGSRGVGVFSSGNESLTIEHVDATSIAVRRVDRSGFTALYMGRIDGQTIIGSVIYYDVNRSNSPGNAVWKGTLRGSPSSLTSASSGLLSRFPFTLRECESNSCLQSHVYPITWTFPARSGQGWLGDHPRPMIIEDLTPGFLVARRIDGPELGGLTAFYFGEIDGRHITGSVVYFDRDRPNQPRSDTWFGEIQSAFVPEEALSASSSPAPSMDRACDENNGLAISVAEAVTLGKQAYHSQKYKEEACWFEIAVKHGDAEAEFYLGLSYFYGQAGTRDPETAAQLLRSAAKKGRIEARIFLACSNPDVQNAMIGLLEEAIEDPNARAMRYLLSQFLGMNEKDSDFKVTDLQAVNLSSDSDFGCTAVFSATRKVTRSDQNGNDEEVLPQGLTSLAPVKQTYTLIRRSNSFTYDISLPYIGSAGDLKAETSKPYIKTVQLSDLW